jgi:hypothetical protein
MVAFALDPDGQRDRFVQEHSTQEQVELLQEDLRNFGFELFDVVDAGARAKRMSVILRMVGRLQPPDDDGKATRAVHAPDLRDIVSRAMNWLTVEPDVCASEALEAMIRDPDLFGWRTQLRHAHAMWARAHRERTFHHPTPAAIREALAGGPPVNAADLRAIVMDELQRLSRGLRTSDITPWKRYWNLNSDGNPTEPLIENQCRDHIMGLLRVRLERYHISAALPETRRGQETRADLFILGGAGRNLPIEAKRHFHREIWVALRAQLQGYANSEGADGFGIYLVFWFGNDLEPTPARDDGKAGPLTAGELEAMLCADMLPETREVISAIVFDVSRTAGAAGNPRKKGKPRKKRVKEAAASGPSKPPHAH